MTDLIWRNEKRRVDDLAPFEKNPRRMTPEQEAKLRESIERFNLVEVPAVDADDRVIAGHQRLRILKLLGRGAEEIDVRVPSRKLTDAEFEEYNLRSNKNTGEWAPDILKLFSEPILLAAGFTKIELKNDFNFYDKAKSGEDDFDAEAERKKISAPISKRGEVYQLGRHRLMCGDATAKEDVAKLMDGKKADCIFTDPPYGVSYEGKTADALTIENDDLKEAPLKTMWHEACKNMVAYTNDGSGFYATVPAGPLHLLFTDVLKALGILRQQIIWVKDQFVMGRSDYHYRHEPILYGWISGAKHAFYAGRTEDTVWEIPRPRASREHPTQKPIELCARAIRNSCPLEGGVLDLFAGSGSTMIAAEQCGATAYLMELDPAYCDVIRARWEVYQKTG